MDAGDHVHGRLRPTCPLFLLLSLYLSLMKDKEMDLDLAEADFYVPELPGFGYDDRPRCHMPTSTSRLYQRVKCANKASEKGTSY